uniref:SERPIN domain-containing protein n=1 Tax=Steinernema glaseri TaxID=37863 RepID=A0A1I7YYJ2_9BILA
MDGLLKKHTSTVYASNATALIVKMAVAHEFMSAVPQLSLAYYIAGSVSKGEVTHKEMTIMSDSSTEQVSESA